MSAQTFADLGINLPPGASGEVRVICPKCGGPKRSKPMNRNDKDLAVNVDDGTFYCHHCGLSGALKTGMNGTSYGSRLKSWQPPKSIAPAPETAQDRMYRWFLKERGIARHVIDRNRITAVIGKTGQEAVAFPYYRDGIHVNTTYRTYDKRFFQESGAERIFYGLDDITADTTDVIICEGQIDKLAFEMAGYKNVLSVPDGAPNAGTQNYGTKLSYLESTVGLFARMDRVYLAADNDPNGQALNEELARRIGREKCWTVNWRDGIKDANDALILIGPPEIQESVELAKPYPIEGVFGVDDLWDRFTTLRTTGMDQGVRSGYHNLDQHYRPTPGSLTVITGYPFHGKGIFLDYILLGYAAKHDWKIALFSPENHPVELHLAHFLEKVAHKPYSRFANGHMTDEEAEHAARFCGDHLFWIEPDMPTLDAILNSAKALHMREGLHGLVIDPWNEILHAAKRGNLSETLYISEALTQIKRFAQERGVHVWLVAHPAKPFAGNTSQAPGLNEIAGSMAFWSKADFGISIWRDVMQHGEGATTKAKILKVRHAANGMTGEVEFTINRAERRMVEVE